MKFTNIIATFCLVASSSWHGFCREAVTNPIRTDGFGAQFQSIIYSMIYSELRHKDFFYTPFSAMQHNYFGDENFLNKKEDLINLIGNVPIAYDCKTARELNEIEWLVYVERNIYRASKSKALQNIKNFFRENKKRKSYFPENGTHIAVHIRRPNKDDDRIAGADVPLSYFLRAVEFLRIRFRGKDPIFHIFSQGHEEEFSCLASPADVRLHLNEELESTFTQMVLADVFVMSPSSLSQSAALISDGEIYYYPYWHRPLLHWRRIPNE